MVPDPRGGADYPPEVEQIERAYFYKIRACSGHSISWLNPDRFYFPLPDQALRLISALCHTTKTANLISIFNSGLRPGGVLATQGDRTFINLSVFLPFDNRNVVGGRQGKKNYDATIVFRTRETAR